MKKSIKDLGDIQGKRALIRVDVNVPLDADKNVTDDTRIQAILPTVKFLKEKGAKKINLLCVLSAPQGVQKVQTMHPDVDIYTAAYDNMLNEHGYIVPGLGDAGDRIFGTK